jgi:pyridoxamine 5'-phosphate oxidase
VALTLRNTAVSFLPIPVTPEIAVPTTVWETGSRALYDSISGSGKLDHVTSDEQRAGLTARLRSLEVFAGELPEFDLSTLPEHPADLFLAWLLEAIEAGVREPHAMTLSTVDQQGRPSSRVLILKGLGDGRFEFATNSLSRKGRELAANPWAALSFYWSEQGRQVRVRGRVLSTGTQRSATDFLARSPQARVEALAGTQSETLEHPEELERALRAAKETLERDPDVVAQEWTLYGLIPDEVEFWQADDQRRHTRLRYRLCDAVWARERLWP